MMGNFITTRVERVCDWARGWSLWPLPFGAGCCALEFMSARASRFDLAQVGAAEVRFSPKQSDLLIVMGTITLKQAPILKELYEQMPRPKWVVAFGACAGSGGCYDNYNTVQGADGIVPVDVYVPGCPPRPEQLFEAIMEIQRAQRRDR